MFKFFRKIRQRLLIENRFSKYLLYAIGEIILVVIGILIALQINNWNEKEKLNTKSHNYLQRLNSDIDEVLKQVKDHINHTEEKQKNATLVLNALEAQELLAKEGDDFNRYLQRYYQFQIVIQNINTFDEMMSAGELELIKSQWLRNALADLASDREFIMEVNQSNHNASKINNNLFQKHIRNRMQNVDTDSILVTSTYDFDAMANDNLFINHISYQAVNWYEIASMYKRYETELARVRDTIVVELKKYNR